MIEKTSEPLGTEAFEMANADMNILFVHKVIIVSH